MRVRRDILQCIGNTSLVALRSIVPANGSRVLLKLESERRSSASCCDTGMKYFEMYQCELS